MWDLVPAKNILLKVRVPFVLWWCRFLHISWNFFFPESEKRLKWFYSSGLHSEGVLTRSPVTLAFWALSGVNEDPLDCLCATKILLPAH